MKKKLFVTAIILAIFSFALIPYTFAKTNMDNAVNGIRNFVGGTENVIEDAGKGVANGIKGGVNAIGNGAKDVTNGIENGMSHDGNRNDTMRTTGTIDGNNGGYTATRTSTDTGAAGLFGNVSNNVWTWMVLAIVGIVIVALVMYYARQNNITTYTHDDGDDE